MSEKCKECGCVCARCTKNDCRTSEVHLHAEIEHLRQSLMEKDSHIVTMETQFLNEADKFPNGEWASMREEIRTWQDKYSRLHEAHKRVQKVNQNLEDKLLKIVDKCETEKGAFTKDIATLSHRLADANYTIHRLSQDNAKYRNDVNLAIQLLQCKPANFVGQKYDSLPTEVQAKVRNYVAQKRSSSEEIPSDVKSITVPISTFPPTAMVYNITKATVEKHSDDDTDDEDKPPVDIVSAAIMAKVLEDRERERIFSKHCDTCVCHKTILMVDSETQTFKNYAADHSTMDPNGLSHKSEEITRQVLNKTGGCTKINQNSSTQIKIERLTQTAALTPKQIKSNIGIGPEIQINPKSSEKTVQSCIANPVDIINDRIWKNNWSRSKLTSVRIEESLDNSRKSDIHLDVINERVWKKETSNINNTTQVTLIEVTNAVNANHQTPEIAASPSFSSDSVIISSSEPSSSSSDLVQSINEKRRKFNNNYSTKDRITGPRNCLVRVSREGSKNILLDNAGQYQTVLYTSPGSGSGSTNKTSTALVHNQTKSNRSATSLSTSSDEAFPILPNDATQLQRVAEWVQSSVGVAQEVSGDPRVSGIVSAPVKSTKSVCTPITMPPNNNNSSLIRENVVVSSSSTSAPVNINLNNHKAEKDQSETEIKDLISFDSTNEDEEEEQIQLHEKDSGHREYGVKITKEMEETYLKLAASLDPVSLRLSTCTSSDITIEKYRKDHKRIQTQKMHEKSNTNT